MKYSQVLSLGAALLPTLASAQLSGTVGPLTSVADKTATKVCNVLDYGGVASTSSDIAAPITSAFADCKTGGVVYIPEGDYGMTDFVTLSGGNAWALQLDGIIYRVDGASSGNMIMIEHATDFEMFSSNSAGAMQGYGYEYHVDGTYGPRLLRTYEVSNFSIHDIALVDSPAFHFSMDTCSSGEVYNMIIRGGYEGGLDGIDVWSDNIWIHDVEVSNKDECVTVKSPASNILIEDIYCNWSGGCAMGSLATDVAISNVIYNNVYTVGSNQMYMIKSNGGSGTVENLQFNNFIGVNNAYSLDFDTAWSSMSVSDGDGITYNNITFNNWKGTCADGAERGPIKVNCPAAVPCTDVTITDFAMWTLEGDSEFSVCENAYGEGECLNTGSDYTSYTTTVTTTAAPSGYSAATMDSDLSTGFDISSSIAIPTIPTSFFPGATPISALMANGAATTAANAAVVPSSTASVPVATSSAVAVAVASSSSVVAVVSSSSTTAAAVLPSSSFVTSIASSAGAAPSGPGGRGGRGGFGGHAKFGGGK